jgi:hypothetical protein
VIIGAGGRPVLCGFADGGRIGTGAAALTPEVDVLGLGNLLRALIIDDGSEAEPIPDRRLAFGRVRAPWSGYQRRALLTLADRATDDVPLRRPPARRLASDILDTVPSAHLGEDAFAALRSSAAEVEPSPRTRRMSLAAIGVGLVLVLWAVTGLGGEGSDAAAVFASLPPTTAPDTTAPSTTPVPAVEDGRIIVAGGHRFEAGIAGDRVAVGDWNCDGVATPALLRPSTGALFMFDSWATEGNDVSVAPARTIPGAVDLHPLDRGDGCSTLIVLLDDGTHQEIR